MELSGKANTFLKRLYKCDLLVIDDFAFKKISPQSAEYLYSIVDERYQRKSIIFTSNRAIEDWMEIFPDQIIANAILDRIAHNAHQIIITGESFRRQHNLKNQNR
jgi:DNA replication protein DnaC